MFWGNRYSSEKDKYEALSAYISVSVPSPPPLTLHVLLLLCIPHDLHNVFLPALHHQPLDQDSEGTAPHTCNKTTHTLVNTLQHKDMRSFERSVVEGTEEQKERDEIRKKFWGKTKNKEENKEGREKQLVKIHDKKEVGENEWYMFQYCFYSFLSFSTPFSHTLVNTLQNTDMSMREMSRHMQGSSNIVFVPFWASRQLFPFPHLARSAAEIHRSAWFSCPRWTCFRSPASS